LISTFFLTFLEIEKEEARSGIVVMSKVEKKVVLADKEQTKKKASYSRKEEISEIEVFFSVIYFDFIKANSNRRCSTL
jgi:hypothetical protein